MRSAANTPSPFVTSALLPGVFLVERPVHQDSRGFFHEVERRLTDFGSQMDLRVRHAQWNHSRSQRGVLRGIHVAQWNKCVYVVHGEVQCVVVDARPESPTFGRYESFILGERRRAMLFVPRSFGNSYLVLSDWADFMYSVDAEWFADGELGIAWDDPDLAIPWLISAPALSDKDQRNYRLRELFPERFMA